MPVEIRPVAAEEYPAFYRAVIRGFGNDPSEDDPDGKGWAEVLPPERTVAVFDGGRIVATLGDFDLDLIVPGGARIPMAGTTVVTVAPTHRRRGLLTAMMEHHRDAAGERGDPVAGLWASETPIYSRFGFGSAVEGVHYEFASDQVVIGPPPDVSVEILDDGAAIDVLPPVYERVVRRPGSFSRTRAWWEHHSLRDVDENRAGRSRLRHAVAVRAGEPVGYVSYRQKQQWERLPDGTVFVSALMAADTAVRRALVSFLAGIDLYPNVRIWNQPVDDPLVWEVADRRRLRRDFGDTLWVRILDVPAALTARTYESDGRIVLGVEDATRPGNAGAYELVVEGGTATCSRTGAEPEASMDVSMLGALYLGGRNPLELHRAGLVAGDRPTMALLGRLFRTAAAPWCPEVF